jgi:AhpD family alkylhydroperoxidase
MEPRMTHPVQILPDALQALLALAGSTQRTSLPKITRYLVELRASQINGCSVCVDMHSKELREAGEPDERLFAVAAWRDSPHFTDAERAALAMTEALTRLADKPEAVTDDIWHEAAKHYDEQAMAALLIEIGQINVWNRLNAATRQIPGKAQ